MRLKFKSCTFNCIYLEKCFNIAWSPTSTLRACLKNKSTKNYNNLCPTSILIAFSPKINPGFPDVLKTLKHIFLPVKALSIWSPCKECVWTFHPPELILHFLMQTTIGLSLLLPLASHQLHLNKEKISLFLLLCGKNITMSFAAPAI